MAVTGTQISDRVGLLLQDTSSIRWGDAERLAWINAGRREMAKLKPTVFGGGTEITHITTVGNKQTIATVGAYKIGSVNANVGSGKAIRPCPREQLDAFRPAWRNDTGDDVQNWWSDEIDPISFWVYPAVGAGAALKCHVHITPTDVASLTETALPFDIYELVLVNYVCYRAFSKEDEAGAVEKAAAYYQLFTAALS